jgi:hypothetical protein
LNQKVMTWEGHPCSSLCKAHSGGKLPSGAGL